MSSAPVYAKILGVWQPVQAMTGGSFKSGVTFRGGADVGTGSIVSINQDFTSAANWTSLGVITPTVTGGVGQTVFSSTDSVGQDQFQQSATKFVYPVTYTGDFTITQRVLTPPKADVQTVGIYFDNGISDSSSAARWSYHVTNHYTGTASTMYHKSSWWTGTAFASTTGQYTETTDTNFDASGLYQRFRRVGHMWYFDLSYDGTNWINRLNWDMTGSDFNPTRIGFICGHALNGTVPAWTCQVDWITATGTGIASPATIYGSNLLMHSRSTDVNTSATNGSAITSLADVAGSRNWTLSTQTGGLIWPTYVTNAINGLPVLRFAGSTALEMIANILTTGTDLTVHAVASASTSGIGLLWAGGPQPMSGNGYSSNNGASQLASVNSNNTWEGASGSTGSVVTTANYITVLNTFHVLTFTRQGTGIRVNVDGNDGTFTSATMPTNNLAHSYLGARYNDAGTPFYWSGDLAEICVVSSAASAANIASYRAYTSARYGI